MTIGDLGDNGRGPRTVKTAADVQRVVTEQLEKLLANPDLDPLRQASGVAQLGQVALRAIEIATLERQVNILQALLRRRKDEQTEKDSAP